MQLGGSYWGVHCRHLCYPDFICDAGALDERVFVLAKCDAEFVDTLMLVEHLKFLKVQVPFLELHALAVVFLYKALSFLLCLKFLKTLVFGIQELSTELGLFVPDLPRQIKGVFLALLGTHLCHLQLGIVSVGGFFAFLPLLLLVVIQGLLPLRETVQ